MLRRSFGLLSRVRSAWDIRDIHLWLYVIGCKIFFYYYYTFLEFINRRTNSDACDGFEERHLLLA